MSSMARYLERIEEESMHIGCHLLLSHPKKSRNGKKGYIATMHCSVLLDSVCCSIPAAAQQYGEGTRQSRSSTLAQSQSIPTVQGGVYGANKSLITAEHKSLSPKHVQPMETVPKSVTKKQVTIFLGMTS